MKNDLLLICWCLLAVAFIRAETPAAEDSSSSYWGSSSVSSLVSGESEIFASLHLNQESPVCPFDRIQLSYCISRKMDVQVAVWTDGSATASLRPVALPDDISLPYDGVIRSLLNEEHDPPSVTTMAISNQGQTLTVNFDRETNSPELLTAGLLKEALVFSPKLSGAAVGTWTDSKSLVIHCASEFLQRLMDRHYKGHAISILVRDSANDRSINGTMSLRPQNHGTMKICLVDSTTKFVVSNIVSVSVGSSCNADLVPTMVGGFTTGAKEDNTNTVTSSLRVQGTLALSGNNGLRVSHNSLPKNRAWGISFWIKLLEGPTDRFRSLFFKGDTSGSRTPSAWLLPKVNGIATRFSTNVSADVGASSITKSLPSKEWVYLTFTFENTSQFEDGPELSVDAPDITIRDADGNIIAPDRFPLYDKKGSEHSFRYSVYVNGVLDMSVYVSDEVLSNKESLSFFKDVSHNGPRAFVQDLSIWDGDLDEVKVLDRYRSGRYSKLSQKQNELTEDLIGKSEMILDAIPTTIENMATVEIVASLLQEAKTRLRDCSASTPERLDIYAEASGHGSAEALFLWGSIQIFGSEQPNSPCGVSSEMLFKDNDHGNLFDDLTRGAYAILLSASMGYVPALVPLATLVAHKFGIQPNRDNEFVCEVLKEIPIHKDLFYTLCTDKHKHSKTLILSSAVFDTNSSLKLFNYVLSYLNKIESSDEDFTFSREIIVTSSQDSLACAMLHAAIVLGSEDAARSLGYRYRHGIGVVADSETAAYYLYIAAGTASQAFHTIGGQPLMESDRLNDHTAKSIVVGNAGDSDELIQHQIVRADEGHIPSALAMADIYYYGARGLPRDQQRAMQYYRMAAETGDLVGMCGAANMYLKGEGTSDGEKNVTEAIRLYEAAVEGGSVSAMNGLGYLYFHGQGVPKNETKAFYYFLAAAEMEADSDSLFNAGHCLQYGLGIDIDNERALKMYSIAARKFGHFDAATRLGVMHHEGLGIKRSATEAIKFLEPASSMGSWSGWLRRGLDQYIAAEGGIKSNALNAGSNQALTSVVTSTGKIWSYLLGCVGWKAYSEVNDTEHEFSKSQQGAFLTKSLTSYLYASDFGYEIAQSNAAFLLSRKGTKTTLGGDRKLLASLQETVLSRSARLGSTNSIVQLGDLYYRHAKEQKDLSIRQRYLDEAIWWYQRASSKDHPLGSYYAGIMFQFGIGVPVNLRRAVRYYDLALRQGGLVKDDQEKSSATLISNMMTAATTGSNDGGLPGNSIGSQSTFTDASGFWSILKILRYTAMTDPSYGNGANDGLMLTRFLHIPLKAFLESVFKI